MRTKTLIITLAEEMKSGYAVPHASEGLSAAIKIDQDDDSERLGLILKAMLSHFDVALAQQKEKKYSQLK